MKTCIFGYLVVPIIFIAITCDAAQYYYDDNGQLTRVVYPSGREASYRYDAAGNLTFITVQAGPRAPQITESPVNVTVNEGQSVKFNVTAVSAIPIQYQWQYNGTPIPGATNQTYTISSVNTTHAGTYTVQVSNTSGSVLSSSALLTVDPVETPSGLSFQWALSMGNPSYSSSEESGSRIEMDQMGNRYVTGLFTGNAVFGQTVLTNRSEYGCFVAKYDANGSLLWAKTLEGSGNQQGFDLAVNESGAVWLTGFFSGQISILGVPLTSGDRDVFIVKYDSSGKPLWAKQGGGSSADEGYGIASDRDDNCYVTGSFYSKATFDGIELLSAGTSDIFLVKYDSAGKLLWAKRFGGSFGDIGYDVAVDNDGNSFITGIIRWDTQFGNIKLITSSGPHLFIAKINPVGEVLWASASSFATPAAYNQYEYGRAITTDPLGNSLITGYFYGSCQFGHTILTNRGQTDIVIAKYDPNGSLIWAKQAGGTWVDSGYGISVDGQSNIFVTGMFSEKADFGGTILTNRGKLDIFVAKYDAEGNLEWVQQAGGEKDDIGYGIAIDQNGNSVLTGRILGPAQFGNRQLTVGGNSDIFIASLSFGAETILPPDLLIHQTNRLIEIVLHGTVGKSYRIQSSPSLNPPQWSTISSVVLTNANHSWMDPDGYKQPKIFYRIVTP